MATITQKIEGFSLENILQIFSLEKKSQTLRVHKEDRTGLLDIDQGELIDAEIETLQGLDAATEILLWDDVQIELLPLRLRARAIDRSLINILLEVSRLKDERRSTLDESGQTLLAGAIDKAQLLQYPEAHQDLVQYLRQHRTDAVGWVWYSRVQGNVEIMRKALDTAAALDPGNALVQQERQKFKAAVVHLNGNVVSKCAFCWAPVNRSTTTCPYCRGHLLISRETLARAATGDPRCLAEARDRYLQMVRRYPRSLSALYCLGLTTFNSRLYREALQCFDKAAKIAPDRKVFADQLKLLLDHLAHRSVGEAPAVTRPAVAPLAEVRDRTRLVLVVEDSGTTRKVISITLGRHGYRVAEATDGVEALSRISEERPDLILLDVVLPRMDGYELLAILKKNKKFKDIPVVLLTSKDGFLNRVRGRLAGAVAYLTKPFDPDRMIAEIEKHL